MVPQQLGNRNRGESFGDPLHFSWLGLARVEEALNGVGEARIA